MQNSVLLPWKTEFSFILKKYLQKPLVPETHPKIRTSEVSGYSGDIGENLVHQHTSRRKIENYMDCQ
jgi:hypothetical protein